MANTDWFIGKHGRGNPHTVLDARHPGDRAWSSGNLARPLVHGSSYFAELYRVVEACGPGDRVWFTDWRGDPDEQLTDDPESTLEKTLVRAHRRGVDVRGLVWRSHWDKLAYSSKENRNLGEDLDEDGAKVLLDMRVRSFGSHHQKFVVVRHQGHPERDVAFVGGIDLCHSRRDDERHHGDPQAMEMAKVFGPTPPWHDVQVMLQGPVVHDVETIFRERWEDPTPLSRNPLLRVMDHIRPLDTRHGPGTLPEQWPAPPPVPGGSHHVQLLRTYPDLGRRRGYPFAPEGERSVARGYSKAADRARSIVFLEDQYLWSNEVAEHFVRALRDNRGLHVVGVLPRHTDQDGIGGQLEMIGRRRAMRSLLKAGGERVALFSPENDEGTPIYVHAKVCVMDDVWASVGSDNFNVRSWTHDSELSAAVVDDQERYARRLRLRLAAEHLGREASDDDLEQVMSDCLDPGQMVRVFREHADALEAWHRAGRRGPRPPGQLRPLGLPRINPLVRLVGRWPYRWVVDPDGRPRSRRGEGQY